MYTPRKYIYIYKPQKLSLKNKKNPWAVRLDLSVNHVNVIHLLQTLLHTVETKIC